MAEKMKIGVLLSGSGTTLQCLIDHVKNGQLQAEIVAVISDNMKAYGLERAKDAGISTMVVSLKGKLVEDYSKEICQVLHNKDVKLVVMAGFLRKYMNQDKKMSVINIHPSLLPAFGGKGMYGSRVHKAVVARGCKVSGCTLHFVNDEYDEGPIIAQDVVSIASDDTYEVVQQKVQAQEKLTLINGLRDIIDGKVKRRGNTVFIEREDQEIKK